MTVRPPPVSERTSARDDTAYDRQRDLVRLVALWPKELADTTLAGHRHLVGLLRQALREQRRRGLAGHWTYDLARHAALAHAYRCELDAFRRRLGAAGAALPYPETGGWSR